MRAHWRAHGPPAHISLAALAGFRPAVAEQIDDPEALAARLRAMGVLA